MQVREKVEKSRNTLFLALEGRIVGSLKRRVRSHLARWEMKNCTPLWHEGHFEVKSAKNWRILAVSEHFWKLRCRKNCTPFWREAPFEVKTYKTHHSRSTFGRWYVEKWTALWHETHFKVKSVKSWRVRSTFGRSVVVLRGRRQAQKDCAPCQKSAECDGFGALSKALAGVGHLKRTCKDAFCVAGAVQETCSSEMLGGPGWFPERGCILEHQIFSFGQMFSRDRCSTSYDLASLFRGRRSTLNRWNWKIAKRIGTRPSALHSLNFPFLKDVSQNCFVFDVVNLEN